MLSEELLRLQLWDELSRGLDVRELLADGASQDQRPAGLAHRLMRTLRGAEPDRAAVDAKTSH